MRFKIDWASLIVGRKFTVFALFYFVLEGNFPSTSPRGAYIWRGDLTEGFLRYRFGGIIFGGAYFRNFTVSEECKISKLRWKILWLPYTAVLLSFTDFFSDIPSIVLVSVYYIYPLPANLISKFKTRLICRSRVHLKTRSGQAPIFYFQYSSERDSMHVITS